MKRVFLAAFAVLAATALAAQEPSRPQTVTLTLDEAIEIALNDNPTIQIADMEIERQDYVRKETVGNLIPSLSASGQYSYAAIKQKVSRDGLSFGADNTVTIGANLNVPLFVPAVYASLKLNDAQIASAIEAARSSRINMVNEVRKSYYNMLMLDESLRVLRESEKLMQETVDNTRMLFEAELGSEYDYLTAQSNLSAIQPNIIQAEGSVEVAEMYMKMLLSLPQEVDIVLDGNLDYYSAEIMNGDGSYSTDISGNSDLRSLDIQAKMLEAQLKIVNAQRMPTIAAFGQLSLAGSDMGTLSFGSASGNEEFKPDLKDYPSLAPFLGMLGPDGIKEFGGLIGAMLMGPPAPEQKGMWWQYPASVGVSISIPIFTGNKINNQAKQAKIAINQLKLQRDYAEQATIMELKTSVSNLLTAKGKMRANDDAVKQAQKAYDISNVRYNGGAGTILELNSAQFQLTQARLNYTQAVYDYLAAHADYERVIGKGFE